MRKRILTICALLLTGLLAACGTQQPQGTESAAAAGTESLPETESAAAAESVEETQPAEQTETGAQETVTGQNTDPQTALGEMEAELPGNNQDRQITTDSYMVYTYSYSISVRQAYSDQASAWVVGIGINQTAKEEHKT